MAGFGGPVRHGVAREMPKNMNKDQEQPVKKTILGIGCSPNGRGSLSSVLLNRALREAEKEGVNTMVVFLSEGYDVEKIQEKILEADGVIFATPTHWFNVSALAKEFIDKVMWRFSGDPWEIDGKPIAVMASCNEDGANQAIMNIVMPLNYCGFFLPPWCALIHNKSMPGHGEDGWQDDPEELCRQLIRYC